MTTSFVRIKFTDGSFTIIFREFNIWLVLIGNVISWWRENTVTCNNLALFCKRRIKDISFFKKISNKFIIMKLLSCSRSYDFRTSFYEIFLQYLLLQLPTVSYINLWCISSLVPNVTLIFQIKLTLLSWITVFPCYLSTEVLNH